VAYKKCETNLSEVLAILEESKLCAEVLSSYNFHTCFFYDGHPLTVNADMSRVGSGLAKIIYII
jgi:hypothetical protein